MRYYDISDLSYDVTRFITLNGVDIGEGVKMACSIGKKKYRYGEKLRYTIYVLNATDSPKQVKIGHGVNVNTLNEQEDIFIPGSNLYLREVEVPIQGRRFRDGTNTLVVTGIVSSVLSGLKTVGLLAVGVKRTVTPAALMISFRLTIPSEAQEQLSKGEGSVKDLTRAVLKKGFHELFLWIIISYVMFSSYNLSELSFLLIIFYSPFLLVSYLSQLGERKTFLGMVLHHSMILVPGAMIYSILNALGFFFMEYPFDGVHPVVILILGLAFIILFREKYLIGAELDR